MMAAVDLRGAVRQLCVHPGAVAAQMWVIPRDKGAMRLQCSECIIGAAELRDLVRQLRLQKAAVAAPLGDTPCD